MTGILASGLDVQVLWDQSANIFPPDRLNVFTVEAIQYLAQKYSFECLELSTPGILDVQIIEDALKSNPHLEIPRFIRYMIENRDENIKNAFQEFLQSSQLSSYGRILLRKV